MIISEEQKKKSEENERIPETCGKQCNILIYINWKSQARRNLKKKKKREREYLNK